MSELKPAIWCKTQELFDKVTTKLGGNLEPRLWANYEGNSLIMPDGRSFGSVEHLEKHTNYYLREKICDGTYITAEEFLGLELVNTKFKIGDIVYHENIDCKLKVIGDGNAPDSFTGEVIEGENIGHIHNSYYDNCCNLVEVGSIEVTNRTCVVCRTKEEWDQVLKSINKYSESYSSWYAQDKVITLLEGLHGNYNWHASEGLRDWDYPIEASVYLVSLNNSVEDFGFAGDFEVGDIVIGINTKAEIKVLKKREDSFDGEILVQGDGTYLPGTKHGGFVSNYFKKIIKKELRYSFKVGDLVCLIDSPYKDMGIVAYNIKNVPSDHTVLCIFPNNKEKNGPIRADELMLMDDMELSLKIKKNVT